MNFTLRFGGNSFNLPSEISSPTSGSPIHILQGQLSYVYLLDALRGWQLAKELRQVTGLPSVCSFKKANPTGVAIGYPLHNRLQQALGKTIPAQSLLACALLRSRGFHRQLNHKAFVALSDPLDLPTAHVLIEESYAGVIAPAYEPKALAFLRQKRSSPLLILEIDPDFEPEPIEIQTLFGFTLQRKRNRQNSWECVQSFIEEADRLGVSPSQKVDGVVGLLTLKYSYSHSLCLTYQGQSIGIGMGQQSPSYAFNIAAEMAKYWMIRQHPRIQSLSLPHSKADREHAVYEFIRNNFSTADYYSWMKVFQGQCLASDGPLSSIDELQEASRIGVRYVLHPLEDIPNSETYFHHSKELGIRNFHVDVRIFD